MSLRNRSYAVEAKDRKRLPKYGEVHKKTLPGGQATIVVRGIFQAYKGDSYHVRVLRGEGGESDEFQNPRRAILWRDDHYLEGNMDPNITPKKLLKKAIKDAMDWAKSSAGKRKIARALKK